MATSHPSKAASRTASIQSLPVLSWRVLGFMRTFKYREDHGVQDYFNAGALLCRIVILIESLMAWKCIK